MSIVLFTARPVLLLFKYSREKLLLIFIFPCLILVEAPHYIQLNHLVLADMFSLPPLAYSLQSKHLDQAGST